MAKRQRKRQKQHKKHSLFLAIHRFFSLLVVFALGGMVAVHFLLPSPETESMPEVSPLGQVTSAGASHYIRENNVYNFLLVGSDAGDSNADTIMVVQLNGNTGGLHLISVPRDTLVYREWSSFPKINAAMSRGIAMLKAEVSYTLGIPLDFYVQIGLDGFIAVVDALGGLDFYVPQDMYHDDEGGFIINLTQGQQLLTGRQTLELVRYRGYANADIGRTETQQNVLKALLTKAVSLGNITKIEEFWWIFQEYVDTNMETTDFLWFAKTVLTSGIEPISLTLEGDGRGVYNGYRWCYELDQAKTLETVNLYLNPYKTQRTLEDLCLQKASSYDS